MKPLISIIIPVFNVEKYLSRCLKSIINQSYNNLEIIIVNDGSTDKSGNICEYYSTKDSRLKVIHKENGGQGSARNLALDVCEGEYVSFVDSDDWIKSDMIDHMLQAIKEEDAQLAVCGICTFNDIKYSDHIYYTEKKVFTNSDLIKEYISKPTIHTGPCNKLYHRKLFDNIRFPNIRAREDAYIMHEVLSGVDRAVYIPECKYIQYIRPGSTEQIGFNNSKLHLLDSEIRLQEFIQENYLSLYNYVEYNYGLAIINLMDDIVGSFSYKKHKDLYEELINKLSLEVKRLSSTVNNLDDKEYRRLYFVSRHRCIFFIEATYKGIKKSIKNIIKMVLRRLYKLR